MKLIKNYWFGGLIGIFLTCFVLLFAVILIAPKQDAKGRGFVACTQKMIDNLFECDKAFWCSIGAISENTLCDIKIIGKGLVDWSNKKQPYPWSNYIFEPEINVNPYIDEKEHKEYLAEFPQTVQEMIKLKELNKELENEQINIKTTLPE